MCCYHVFLRRFKCKHLKQVNYRIIPAYSYNTVQSLHGKDCTGGVCVARVSSVGWVFCLGLNKGNPCSKSSGSWG